MDRARDDFGQWHRDEGGCQRRAHAVVEWELRRVGGHALRPASGNLGTLGTCAGRRGQRRAPPASGLTERAMNRSIAYPGHSYEDDTADLSRRGAEP